MSESCDVVVIGAGIIGLAVARALALVGREVLILERQDAIGTETSSRNSEVIHAGIYYPKGSLKAKMCVEGKQLLYQYCKERNISHRRIGKVIVATSEAQESVLEHYQIRSIENGAGELRRLSRDEVHTLEPHVECFSGVFSPTTGIIDSHEYMTSLLGDLEAHGGMVAFNSKVEAVSHDDALFVESSGLTLNPRTLVNAAGLWAPSLSRQLGGQYQDHFAKGHYYTLSGDSPFNHLVYPVAESGGLGVHVTLDIGGQARFGPDVEWVDEVDYSFCDSNRQDFIDSVRQYYPSLDETRLVPGYTGIRPKLVPEGGAPGDFVINGPRETGVPNYVELLGIESPGLTASLAIANYVLQLINWN
ncbi:MAG: NAD(P)/FAD-dependent oxidoreductase [Gammaproteobacteria bacterium]|nr:NAD(P)/FAD-dependent oxidoreductase [Gammaproteobacteria bacterium]MYD81156.1 NAD(P)/FAD-dependent oxidoreductase [Gammaproteobacteria bacterium]